MPDELQCVAPIRRIHQTRERFIPACVQRGSLGIDAHGRVLSEDRHRRGFLYLGDESSHINRMDQSGWYEHRVAAGEFDLVHPPEHPVRVLLLDGCKE